MSASGIAFADFDSGTIQMSVWPFATGDSLYDFTKNVVLNLNGKYGLGMWFMDTTANPYHHLFDVVPPRSLSYGITRNTNGLSFFHTPLCITSDHGGDALIDFTNLPVRPDIGDDTTWMLVVNGPELAKEIFVLDSTWADYVFDPGYNLRPIGDDTGNSTFAILPLSDAG